MFDGTGKNSMYLWEINNIQHYVYNTTAIYEGIIGLDNNIIKVHDPWKNAYKVLIQKLKLSRVCEPGYMECI